VRVSVKGKEHQLQRTRGARKKAGYRINKSLKDRKGRKEQGKGLEEGRPWGKIRPPKKVKSGGIALQTRSELEHKT